MNFGSTYRSKNLSKSQPVLSMKKTHLGMSQSNPWKPKIKRKPWKQSEKWGHIVYIWLHIRKNREAMKQNLGAEKKSA